MTLAQVLARGDQEAAGAGRGVADHVLGCRGHHLDHEPDDVAGGAELAVLTGGGDLAEHVLVEVALGVAIVHRDRVQHLDHLDEQAGVAEAEAGIAHVPAVGGALRPQATQEGEDVLVDHLHHLPGLEVPEAGPAHVVIETALVVPPLREDPPLHGDAQRLGLVLLQGLEVVQALDEEEIGDLLDHREGVRDPAGPEGVPDAVDLVADFTCEHLVGFCSVGLGVGPGDWGRLAAGWATLWGRSPSYGS
jgi:hypothetical protein